MRLGFFFLVAGLSLATISLAQPIIDYDAMPEPRQVLTFDLTKDGLDDRVSAYALNEMFDVVTIDVGTGSSDFSAEYAFVVPINLSDSDTLEQFKNNNLRINWGCFACGRYHTARSAIIRVDVNEAQVIGYEYYYADRVYAAVFSCSVNLLTGKAIITADDIETRAITHEDKSYPASELSTHADPSACAALKEYDDAFMEEHFSKNN